MWLHLVCILFAGVTFACAPSLSQIPVPLQGVKVVSDGPTPQGAPVIDLAQQGLGLDHLMKAEETITGRPLMAGNRVKLLLDGPQTFKAMFTAMERAQHHIHLETFIIDDKNIGQRLADILVERRQAGVEVRMIYDAFGALDADPDFFARLRASGVRLYEHHPLSPLENIRVWRLNNRHHRKIVIVDGRLAFIGGMNISDSYSNSSLSSNTGLKDGWRDTQVQLEGPGVRQVQALFVDFWSRLEGSADLSGPAYFPDIREMGADRVQTVHSTAGDTEVDIYRLYLAAIASAGKRIWITQGYFSPDARFIEALLAAGTRGVDVRLLLPGLTDSWITINSSRKNYQLLLSKGIRIFERKNVLQHAKTAVIDGAWSTVGSANLDYRSFLHANEAILTIWGDSFAAEMEALFLDDQKRSQEIIDTQWQQRPWHQKALEFFASRFVYWL